MKSISNKITGPVSVLPSISKAFVRYTFLDTCSYGLAQGIKQFLLWLTGALCKFMSRKSLFDRFKTFRKFPYNIEVTEF